MALALVAAHSSSSAQSPTQYQNLVIGKATNQSVDFGPHPSEGADAIVVITPDADHDLHRPQKSQRTITGTVHSNERSIVAQGSITHAPDVIIAPLQKGKPVKLFLRRYPGRNDYYITGVFSPDFPSEATK